MLFFQTWRIPEASIASDDFYVSISFLSYHPFSVPCLEVHSQIILIFFVSDIWRGVLGQVWTEEQGEHHTRGYGSVEVHLQSARYFNRVCIDQPLLFRLSDERGQLLSQRVSAPGDGEAQGKVHSENVDCMGRRWQVSRHGERRDVGRGMPNKMVSVSRKHSNVIGFIV